MTQYSEARYSFIFYALVSFLGMVTAFKISPKLEDVDSQINSMIYDSPVM